MKLNPVPPIKGFLKTELGWISGFAGGASVCASVLTCSFVPFVGTMAVIGALTWWVEH